MDWITGRASEHLSRMLKLPADGDEQDWDIQLANSARLLEFIRRYPEFSVDDEYAFAMAALIIASFDERLLERIYPLGEEFYELMRIAEFDVTRMYTEEECQLWAKIAVILKSDKGLFDALIRYWAAEGKKECAFACTLFFRNEFCDRM
ncbi:hypothetical protein ABLO27_17870 [Roseibium sp. SCPC15]|jgi:hypothetical protein|uniref:hypothetical protein n=1 Tax=Roseibium sp. SCP15 TaxID=3141376 RepID=UPI0033391F27